MRPIEELELVLRSQPDTLPPCVWGGPGIGKSAMVKQIAAKLGWKPFVWTPGARGDGDAGVIPVPEDGVITFPGRRWVRELNSHTDGALLFVDEINTAPPALQPALLGLLLDGVVGDEQLLPHVRRCAAANPTDQAAGGWDLAEALSNRLVHLEWGPPSPTDWADWLAEQEVVTPGKRKAKSLLVALAKSPRLSTALAGRPLWEERKEYQGRFPQAFCTPRSLTTACWLLGTVWDRGLSEDASLPLVRGAIGEARALPILTWIRENDLPDPEALLNDPESWKPDKHRPDRTFAVCISVADAYFAGNGDGGRGRKPPEKKKLLDRYAAAWRVLDRSIDAAGKDIVAISARRLAEFKHRPEGGLVLPPVSKTIERLRGVVLSAGIT